MVVVIHEQQQAILVVPGHGVCDHALTDLGRRSNCSATVRMMVALARTAVGHMGMVGLGTKRTASLELGRQQEVRIALSALAF